MHLGAFPMTLTLLHLAILISLFKEPRKESKNDAIKTVAIPGILETIYV